MKGRRDTPEQTIAKLREADAPSGNGRATRRLSACNAWAARPGSPPRASTGDSAARQNPSLIPASLDPSDSGMGWKIAYTAHELRAIAGVLLKTMKREASGGHIVSAFCNGKVAVYRTDDIVDWLRRRRSIPTSTETRQVLKTKRSRRASRPAALPTETEESGRRHDGYHNPKRRPGRGRGSRR